jgi:hypothetical protein
LGTISLQRAASEELETRSPAKFDGTPDELKGNDAVREQWLEV